MGTRVAALAVALTVAVGTLSRLLASRGDRSPEPVVANSDTAPAPNPQPPEKGLRSDIVVPAIVALATALLANAGVVLGILSGYVPGLRPELPPADLTATISNLEIENRNVAWSDYVLDAALELQGSGRPINLSQGGEYIGHVVGFDMDLQGLEGDPVVVKWTMYNARNAELFPPFYKMTSQTAFESITPRSDRTHIRVRVWVPVPVVTDPVGFKIDVYDKKGGGRLASFKVDDLTLSASSEL